MRPDEGIGPPVLPHRSQVYTGTEAPAPAPSVGAVEPIGQQNVIDRFHIKNGRAGPVQVAHSRFSWDRSCWVFGTGSRAFTCA